MPQSLNQTKPKKTRPALRIRLMVAIPMLVIVTVFLTGIVFLKIVEIKLSSASTDANVVHTLLDYLTTALWLCVIFAAIAGVILGYTIVQPIKQITSTVDKLATGDLSRTIHIDTHTEFDQLGNSFNRMVSNLRNFVYERNKYIIESMAGAVVTLDKSRTITMVNAAAESLLGISASDCMGKPIERIIPMVSDNQRLLAFIRTGLEEQKMYSSIELDLVTTDKKRLPIELTSSPLKDKNDQVIGLILTFKNLSKQKLIQQQLHRSDRLAAIGTLATALAHEIRNPLGSMRGLAQLLQEDIPADDQKRQYTKVIIKEIDRLNKIVEELLSFGQAGSAGMEFGEFNMLVKEALAIAKESAASERNIQVNQKYDETIPVFKMEKEKLIQAFLNLIINAYEASPENSTIEISTQYGFRSPEYPVPNRGFAIFEIKNYGSTIAPEDYERIFDPFYTTKKNGTGLGLSIAHQIVAAHSGIIQVESVRGESTIFRIRLPIIDETIQTTTNQGNLNS
ncbi:MAG: PAS domain-containing protein [bacterium]|nr:PAS domain-containing protein [bacterium]